MLPDPADPIARTDGPPATTAVAGSQRRGRPPVDKHRGLDATAAVGPSQRFAALTGRTPELLVFAVAIGVRLGLVARGAGFSANFGYDQSVYYNAAAALVHGRVPYNYNNFVLLHPPLIALALAPFAMLGHLTSDHTGYMTANVAFAVVGALNAPLVVVVARRLGLARIPAATGGLFYAVWFATVNAEYSARLEPLGNFALLLACWALIRALQRPSARRFLLAGVFLGAAVNVKIWFFVPAVVVLVWLVASRRARSATHVLAGVAATAVVIDLPMLIASRGEMWSMVISAQLGRQPMSLPLLDRVSQLSTVWWASTSAAHRSMAAPVIAAGVVLALVLVTSWRIRAVRLFTVLTVAALVTLLVSPSWFPQYTDFVAAPFAICAAAAVEALPTGYRLAGCLPPLAATALTTSLLINGNFPTTAPWHTTPDLVAAARGQRCTMSDSPSGLIGLDVLDHDLNNGCRNWVDVIGRTYLGRDKGPMPRTTNAAWQRDLAGYLRSGQAAYLSLFGRQLARDTYRLVIKDGVLAQAGSGGLIKRIYRIAHP